MRQRQDPGQWVGHEFSHHCTLTVTLQVTFSRAVFSSLLDSICTASWPVFPPKLYFFLPWALQSASVKWNSRITVLIGMDNVYTALGLVPGLHSHSLNSTYSFPKCTRCSISSFWMNEWTIIWKGLTFHVLEMSEKLFYRVELSQGHLMSS